MRRLYWWYFEDRFLYRFVFSVFNDFVRQLGEYLDSVSSDRFARHCRSDDDAVDRDPRPDADPDGERSGRRRSSDSRRGEVLRCAPN